MDKEYEIERARFIQAKNSTNPRFNRRAGIHRPAFGHFKCSSCKHNWVSWKAWKYFGQACEICFDRNSKPTDIQAIHFYYCTPCDNLWKNIIGEKPEPEVCSVCDKIIHSSGLAPPSIYYEKAKIAKENEESEEGDEGEEGETDTTDAHKMELCEKCNYLNRNRILGKVVCYHTSYWKAVQDQDQNQPQPHGRGDQANGNAVVFTDA